MPASPYSLAIHLQDAAWRQQLPRYRAVIGKAARAALIYEKLPEAAVNFALMNDAQIMALNHQFRGKNNPTNVLSFADDSGENLGDIALALQVIMAEAFAQHKTLSQHLSHLVVHGILHLLGDDHESDSQAQAMEAKEIAILSAIDVENPYESR
jgi:probable rRNA maturation factor